MVNKIIINKESWEYFFLEITKKYKYDINKVYIELSEMQDFKIWKTIQKAWVILKIKNINGTYFLEIIFWLKNDENLDFIEKKNLKEIIEKFIFNEKEKDFFIKNKWNIFFDYLNFLTTWCWIILIELEQLNWNFYNIFHTILEKIYTFLYKEIIKINIDEIIINDPQLEKYEKKVEIPYWLEWLNLEEKQKIDDKQTKIEKFYIKDMWWNKNLKIELEKLISFYKNKEHFKKWDISPPRWILLYGPPWTWKTLTAKIIANEININFYTLSSWDIISKWLWDSTKNLQTFFKNLQTPCIVFMDEIDSIAPDRDWWKNKKEIHSEQIQVINTLLQEIDGFWEKKDILFIWATNRIESVDKAFLRAWRLDYKILVDYPDFEARKEIWKIYLTKAKKKIKYNFLDENINLDILALKSENFTWADIAEAVRRLLNDYAIWSLISNQVMNIIWSDTTLKWLLYIIWTIKNERFFNKNITSKKEKLTLNDIWWSKLLKEELSKIINQYKNKELFDEIWVKLPRWILLYGPPWTWKTLTAKVLAWEIWEIFYSIKATDFLSQWTNASSENLSKIFDNFESPSIVFIDEIDAIAKNRDKSWYISEEDIKVLNTLLEYIDGFWEKKDILFIWATNRIEALDKAILRAWRFDKKILVDYPDFEARKEIWEIYIKKSKTITNKQDIFNKNIDYNLLSKESINMSWSDIAEIIRRVKEIFAIKESQKNIKKTKLLSNNIKTPDILNILEEYKKENKINKKDDFKIWFNILNN